MSPPALGVARPTKIVLAAYADSQRVSARRRVTAFAMPAKSTPSATIAPRPAAQTVSTALPPASRSKMVNATTTTLVRAIRSVIGRSRDAFRPAMRVAAPIPTWCAKNASPVRVAVARTARRLALPRTNAGRAVQEPTPLRSLFIVSPSLSPSCPICKKRTSYYRIGTTSRPRRHSPVTVGAPRRARSTAATMAGASRQVRVRGPVSGVGATWLAHSLRAVD